MASELWKISTRLRETYLCIWPNESGDIPVASYAAILSLTNSTINTVQNSDAQEQSTQIKVVKALSIILRCTGRSCTILQYNFSSS